MKQVTQRPRDGHVTVIDVPAPTPRPGWVLVANSFSVISPGTERAKIELGEKSLLQKARGRPDLVSKVIQRARVEGVRSAVGVARERLEALAPLGYSSSGTVLQLGEGVEGFAPGDRVACGGADWANHAEIISVPRTLIAAVPEGVSLDAAAYTTLGAIALHGMRQSEAAIGERVGVIGAAVLESTSGIGLDSVLVCAATESTDPMELAVRIARDRGRIVVVGEIPVGADRRLLYEKELDVRLSRSYGPGRYDREYEQYGRDLPVGYVRVAAGRLDPLALTTHRFPVDRAAEAYKLLVTRGDAGERAFGILLEYEPAATPEPRRLVRASRPSASRIGLIGAGAFARSTLLPALRRHGAELVVVASETGLAAADVAARFGFQRAAGSAEEIVAAEDVDAVVIATRHSTHARLAIEAIRAGKHVFVEKPLAIEQAELDEIEAALTENVLMVGFNRRFASLTEELHGLLRGLAGMVLMARVNAGPLARENWMNDPEEGGRLIGEGCHFVDLLAHLAGSPFTSVYAAASPHPAAPLECSDDVVATFRFTNGSVGTLVYAGNGDTRLPKERIEVFGGGLSAVLDDFRRLEIYRNGRRTVTKHHQDKGHDAQIECFVAAIAGDSEPPPASSYISSSRATLALAESLRIGAPVQVPSPR